VDHRYIEQHSLADRYLEHALAPRERADFETHLVDCQECTDRILLAEMFHNRNGTPKAGTRVESPLAAIPFRVRFVAAFKPWQLLLLGSAAAILLLLIPCWIFLWELRSLRP
jgi:hypothetical protein